MHTIMKRYREELIGKKESLESSIDYWENQIPIIHIWVFILGVTLILCLLLCGAAFIMQESDVLQFFFSMLKVLILLFAIMCFLLWFLPKRVEQLKDDLYKTETELRKY